MAYDELLRPATQKELKSEIASIDRSISDLLFYGGNSKILINGDSVLRSRGRGKGLDIYDELERDAHVGSVMGKRKRAVTAREWGLTPASDDSVDVDIAEFCKHVLTRLRFDKLTKSMMGAVLKGYSVVELIWQREDNRLVPVMFLERQAKRFVFDIERRPRLLTSKSMIEGEELPARKFIVHTVGGTDGSPYGLGLGHLLFWPTFFKRQNISFWLIFNDKYGSPTAKGTYPTSADATEQNKLLAVLRSISREAGIIVPEGMEVALLEASKAGTDGYERMCHYMDAEISKAVLGETQTTTVGNSGGNRALGEVHNEVRVELAKDDADDLSYTINETLLRWIVEYNFPGRKPPTVWRNFDEAEDLDKVADRDTKLKALGWERDDESFAETYGMGYRRVQVETPTPNDDEDATQFAESPGFVSRVRTAVRKVLGFADGDVISSQQRRNRDDQATIADGAVQLAKDWDTLTGPRVRELQTLLDETGDLALFRERLNEMAQTATPDDEFVERVARATFASRLAGRLPKRKIS